MIIYGIPPQRKPKTPYIKREHISSKTTIPLMVALILF